MRGTPVWDARLATMPTAVRELRAENAYRLPVEALARLTVPALLLVGSESPEWARRSTEAYAEAIPGVEVVTLHGPGPRRQRRGPRDGGRRAAEAQRAGTCSFWRMIFQGESVGFTKYGGSR